MLGYEVASSYAGDVEASKNYEIHFDGTKLSSGIYFYKLQNGKEVQIQKIVLKK